MVQRPFNFAIVDEVDSILIDEARTPLIISGPTDDKSELYMQVDAVVKQLEPSDYEKDEKQKTIILTEDGTEKVERMLEDGRAARGRQPLRFREHAGRPPPQPGAARQHDVQARHRLHRQGRQGRHHRRVHRPHDGRPALVGRPAPGGRGQGRRRDRAREPDDGLDHLPELFPHVPQAVGHDRHRGDRGGGILRHLQDERRHDPDQRAGPARRRGGRVLQEHARTSSRRSPRRSARSSEPASRCWSARCRSRSPSCCREFLQQGRRQAQGAQRALPRAGSAYRRAGGPHGRGDDRDQHGRPRHRHPARRQSRVPHGGRAPGPGRGTPERDARGREDQGRDRRRRSSAVLAAGGLFVLGTERHESRRIDNQLRGRSGRQGDPGLSRFYLSLDDDLLRIFGPRHDVRPDDEQEPRGRRGDRQPVDVEGDRDRAEEGRGAQLRHPQAGRRISTT